MPLIVEDGSIVAGANSYVDFAYIRDFATARNLPIMEQDDDVLEPLAILAMDYLQLRNWKGTQTDKLTQTLDWPRDLVYDYEGDIYLDNIIPDAIKNAQVWLINYAFLEIQLFLQPTNEFQTVGMVIEKRVGPLVKKYSDRIFSSWNTASSDGTVRIPIVEALLAPFIISLMPLRTIRI